MNNLLDHTNILVMTHLIKTLRKAVRYLAYSLHLTELFILCNSWSDPLIELNILRSFWRCRFSHNAAKAMVIIVRGTVIAGYNHISLVTTIE